MRQPSVAGLARRARANPAYQRTAELADGIVDSGPWAPDIDLVAEQLAAGTRSAREVADWRVGRLHQLRLAYQEARAGRGQWPAELAELRTGLESDGVHVWRGLVGPDELAAMQAEMDAFVARIEADHLVATRYQSREGLWPEDAAVVSNDAFAWSPELVAMAGGPPLLEIAEGYLGPGPVVQRAQAMRYQPHQPSDRHQFRWHHDLEGRRLKAMVLLTDVGSGDQPMTYVAGSHRRRHSIHRYHDNRLRLGYAERYTRHVEPRLLTGVAGDVIFFDSNGLHRGTRRPTGAVRDVLVIEYAAPGSPLMGGRPVPDAVHGLSEDGQAAFATMLATEPVWERTVDRGGWLDQLIDVESWAVPVQTSSSTTSTP